MHALSLSHTHTASFSNPLTHCLKQQVDQHQTTSGTVSPTACSELLWSLSLSPDEPFRPWALQWKHSMCCAVPCWHLMRWSASVTICWASVIAICPTSWSTWRLARWLALTLVMPLVLPHRCVCLKMFVFCLCVCFFIEKTKQTKTCLVWGVLFLLVFFILFFLCWSCFSFLILVFIYEWDGEPPHSKMC